jgi:hypothetical protein
VAVEVEVHSSANQGCNVRPTYVDDGKDWEEARRLVLDRAAGKGSVEMGNEGEVLEGVDDDRKDIGSKGSRHCLETARTEAEERYAADESTQSSGRPTSARAVLAVVKGESNSRRYQDDAKERVHVLVHDQAHARIRAQAQARAQGQAQGQAQAQTHVQARDDGRPLPRWCRLRPARRCCPQTNRPGPL